MTTSNDKTTQLEIGADASGALGAFEQVKKGANELSQALKKAGEEGGKGLEFIGPQTREAAKEVERATKSISQSIERAMAAAKAGGRGTAGFFEEIAKQRGADLNALKPLLDQYRAVEEAQRRAEGSMQNLGLSAKQTTAALRQVPAQFTDIVTSLQGGQAPLTVLLQQGGQLKDVFGGVAPAAKALGGYIVGLINPLTLAAAAAAALAYGFFKGAEEAQAFNKALVLSGNAAGTTVGQLTAMAERLDGLGTTQAKATESLLEFINAGVRASDGLERYTLAAINLEKVGGPAVAATAKAFADLGNDPLKASVKLNESTNFLTRSVYEQIKALEEQGRATDAARVAQDAYANAINDRTPKILEQLGLIERKWMEIKDGAKEAGDALLSIGRTPSLQDRRNEAQLNISRAQDKINRVRSGEVLPGVDIERVVLVQKQIIDQNKVIIQDIDERLRREQQAAGLQSANAQFLKDSIAAEGELSKLGIRRISQAQEEENLRQRLRAGGIQELEVEKAVAAFREKNRDKKADSEATRELEAQQRLLAELNGLSSSFYEDWDRLNALFKSGVIKNVERLEELQGKLLKDQPFQKAADKNTEAEFKDAMKAAEARADIRRKEEQAIEAEFERRRAADQAAAQSVRDRIAGLSDESEALELSRAKNITLAQAVNEVTLARLRDKLSAAKDSGGDTSEIERQIALYERLGQQIDRNELNKFLDPSRAKDFGDALTKAFDGAGNSLVKMVSLIERANEQGTQNSAAARLAKDQKNFAALAEIQARAQRQSIELYAGMTGAAKNFFSEGSRGYKTLEAAETAFRVYQLASDLQKGLSAAAVGIANQAQGDPYTAVPRMAAMAAVMAGLGFAVSGSFSGGGSTGGDGAKIATGKGTVFGDAEAKSESLSKSIEHLGDTAELQLRTQSGMLDSLKSIESRIGGVTNQVLRSGAASNAADRFGITTGTFTPGSVKNFGGSNGGLFEVRDVVTKVLANIPVFDKITQALFGQTIKVTGAGLFAGAQDLGSILADGFSLKDFADVNSSKKFFGLKVSNKNSTQYQDADPGLARQFGLIFQDFASAITLAAGPLDLALGDVQSRLNSFVVDIGKIDLQGLTGEQIQEKLGAVLGAAADKLAESALPGLQDFQRVGEGYFETTIRVASGIETAGAALDFLGIGAIKFGDVARKQGDVATEIVRQSIAAFESLDGSISSVGELITTLDGTAEDLVGTYRDLIDVRASLQSIGISGDVLTASLIRGAGGLDALSDSVGTFFDSFLSEEEKLNARRARLQQDAARIGITSLPTDRAGFRDLVSAAALNATTEAGQRFLAQVLGLADAFDEVATSAENAAEKLAEARRKDAQGLQSALDSILPKVLTPAQLEAQRYARASDQLAGLGLDINASVLKGASPQAIVDFAQAFVLSAENSDAAKTALLGVASSLLDLKDAAAQAARTDAIKGIQGQLKTLRDTIGDTSVIDSFETVSQAFVRNRSELEKLETGLSNLLGTTVKTAQEALADLLQTQKALQSYRTGSLADSITDARLRSLDPASRIASLRGQEAALFGQLSTAADPVSVAQRLQGVVIQRIKEEAALRNKDAQAAADLAKKARDSQISTLREQISGFERLKRLAQDISQFTGSLRFSDLSPLAFDQQLGAAKSLFESTLAKAQAGDADAQGLLTGNARAFIEEARSFYASGPEFAAIFGQVTSALDSLGLAGQNADPQLTALQSQLTALEALQQSQVEEQNTAAEELAALQSIDAALLLREQSLESLIDKQTGAAREQIEALRQIVTEQRAQIAQAAEATKRLETQLEKLNDTSTKTYSLAVLEAERPRELTV